MNAAPLHLMLVHIPIVMMPCMTAILFYGLKRKNPDLVRTALMLLVLTSLIMIVAYLTGEGAEETIEHLPGIIEDNIEKHEDTALYALLSVLLTGTLSFVALIWARMRPIALGLALMSSVLLIWTGSLGGYIRHSEEINQTTGAQGLEVKK